MIDNVSIKIKTTLPVELGTTAFEYKGEIYRPVCNKEGLIKRYSADAKNGLRIDYYPINSLLYINNSLHKACSGNNYSDFKLSQIVETLCGLSDTLSINVFDGKIVKLEYGCNIQTNYAKAIYNSLISFKGRRFSEMQRRGVQYGSKCELTQYSIKAYDKTYQVKVSDKRVIDENLLRWEVGIKSMQSIQKRKDPIPIITVGDLVRPSNFQFLADDMINKFNQVIKGPIIDVSGLSIRKKTAIARMLEPTIKEEIRQNHSVTYAMDRKIYNEISIGNTPADAEAVSKMLTEKCTDLINS